MPPLLPDSLPPSPDVRGFLPDDEGQHLYQLALEGSALGPILEIGSYCGRSTIWLAEAARQLDSVVIALDHHRGSEEHQPGEFFHDDTLLDEQGRFDSLREFRKNIANAGVEDHVIALVANSAAVAHLWQGQFGLVFIDGGHSLDAALTDWRLFGTRVLPGGILAIHDVFPDATEGGQAPFTIWRLAMASGLFEEHSTCGTLRALRRVGASP